MQRGTCNPVWEQVLTLRCVFVPGTREELVISCWHEDVFEDELIGRETLDISAVLHDREVADEWLELIDERGRRAIGAVVRIVVANGKAPPLMQLCAAEDVTLDQLEKSIDHAGAVPVRRARGRGGDGTHVPAPAARQRPHGRRYVEPPAQVQPQAERACRSARHAAAGQCSASGTAPPRSSSRSWSSAIRRPRTANRFGKLPLCTFCAATRA